MRQCSRQWFRWTAVAAWMGLIFLVSGQPRLPVLWGFPGFQDIAGHFAAYALLALLLRWALAGAGVRRASLWAAAAAVLYGISDEFHQAFVPGRHPDTLDVLIDALGAGAALAAHHLWRCWAARRPVTTGLERPAKTSSPPPSHRLDQP